MKERIKNSVLKKILIIIIIVIMSANFIVPNCVYAASFTDKVVSGVFYLVAYVGDVAMMGMQKLMVGTAELTEQGEYKIKYSPGIIFSNVVPALDVNFIAATEADNEEVTLVNKDINSKKEMLNIAKELKVEDFINPPVYTIEETTDYNKVNDEISEFGIQCTIHYSGKDGNIANGYDIYFLDNKQYNLTVQNLGDWGSMISVKHLFQDGYKFAGFGRPKSISLYLFNGKLYKIETFSTKSVIYQCKESSFDSAVIRANGSNTVKLESTAFKLKDNIARWYIALRTFALVGLLSVLVYLGIRMLLNSTSSQEQAKYKNMLKDWVLAICILFVLHYLMAFMLGFVDKINNMISQNVVADTITNLQEDTIISQVRQTIGDSLTDSEPGLDIAGFTIMYFVLVILTISFTFQYLKRVVYMAFLTMIAPLIALTYPIDKVKDGKAQAFSFWLKEYIVNCLIQPVHLLLYTLLVTNAIEFAEENILYSIVAITFLMPAEKIIKQMFGINSQSSYNTLSAAAGGAMVMNMLNKAKSLGPRGASKSSSASGDSSEAGTHIRTATRNGMNTPGATTGISVANSGNGTLNSGNPVGGQNGGGAPGSGNPAGGQNGGGAPGSGNPAGGQNGGGAPGSGNPAGGQNGGGAPGLRNPARNTTGRMAGLARMGRKITGPSLLRSSGKWIAKTVPKTLAGVAGASVGLAASIADGDTSDLLHKTVLGAGAGMAIGNGIESLGGNIAGAVGDLKEEYMRGKMGDEAYENAQLDKKFYEGKGYQKILSSTTLSSRYSDAQIKEQTQMFLDNGITDAGAIQEALESGVNGDEYKTITDLGVGVKDVKKYSKIRSAKSSLRPDEIASRMAIAKNMPTELYGDKDAFVRYAKRYGIQKTDAETLFSDIDDFA